MTTLKKLGFILVLLVGSFLTVSCNDDSKDSTTEKQLYRRTVIIYMAAQNSLGASSETSISAMEADSSEIAAGIKYLSTTDNVVLFLDDENAPRLYRFYKSENGSTYYKVLKTYTEDVSSTDPSTLAEVLKIADMYCPSQSYGLILWSHGTSWLPDLSSYSPKTRAFGIDVGIGGDMENDTAADGQAGHQMEIEEIASAISESGLHMDYILFDACIMQAIEVAYSLRHVTDYIIGSPAITSAYGYVYHDLIKEALFAWPLSDENISTIADTHYYDIMENPDWKQKYQDMGCVISVIKTSELENLATATATYLQKYVKGGTYPNLSSTKGYVDYRSTYYPDSYDINDAMSRLLPEADWQKWHETLSKCVIHSRISDSYYWGAQGTRILTTQSNPTTFCGVSMFVPQGKYNYRADINYNEAFRQTEWYEAAGWASAGW